jgi:hypothetical protein
MRNTVHIPTLTQWLRDLTGVKNPTNYQLVEAWQIAQTLHGILYPVDQQKLDDARRNIVSYLSRSDNKWSRPGDNLHSHTIVPSRTRIKTWLEIELTPELSWSIALTGKTVPNKFVKSLRIALGKQHNNLKHVLHDVV